MAARRQALKKQNQVRNDDSRIAIQIKPYR